ncbi:hypothetical protein F4861DRAFT_514544 [Xylaria intraflava]|nr:hypothetical protein F4861DRAFT_514544 [Xylaria intraflava]
MAHTLPLFISVLRSSLLSNLQASDLGSGPGNTGRFHQTPSHNTRFAASLRASRVELLRANLRYLNTWTYARKSHPEKRTR